MISFWIGVEKLRKMELNILRSSAYEIFQDYVTPSADKVIKLDTQLVRGMEEFIYGELCYFLVTQPAKTLKSSTGGVSFC